MDIINDILDFSKIESGQIQLEHIDFDLFDLVKDVSDFMVVRAQEKGIELLVDLPIDGPRMVCGDFVHLRQVLLNLVGNAIKFTDEGYVCIWLHVEFCSQKALQYPF